MAIATYAALQSTVSDWLARPDLTVSQLDTMVLLFEAYVNRTLRSRKMETVTAMTTSGGSVALPTDYIAFRKLVWSSDGAALTYLSPVALQNKFPEGDAGTPRVFTIIGDNLITRPVDDTTSAFSLDYYAKLETLVGNQTNTNWLLVTYPDAYVFGVLLEANAYLMNSSAAALWKQRRDEVLHELIVQSNLSKSGTAVPGGWIV